MVEPKQDQVDRIESLLGNILDVLQRIDAKLADAAVQRTE